MNILDKIEPIVAHARFYSQDSQKHRRDEEHVSIRLSIGYLRELYRAHLTSVVMCLEDEDGAMPRPDFSLRFMP